MLEVPEWVSIILRTLTKTKLVKACSGMEDSSMESKSVLIQCLMLMKEIKVPKTFYSYSRMMALNK